MKILLSFFILSLIFACSSVSRNPASAGGGKGTRTDGNVASGGFGNKGKLLDLSDKSFCKYKSVTDLYKENPKIMEVITELQNHDFIFAKFLKYEIDSLNICMVNNKENFKTLKVQLTYRKDENAEDESSEDDNQTSEIKNIEDNANDYYQLAIRRKNSYDVYINEPEFRKLTTDEHRAYTIIHEAMHSFIYYEAPDRDAKIAATVQGLNLVVNNRMNDKEFRKLIEKQKVGIPVYDLEINYNTVNFINYLKSYNLNSSLSGKTSSDFGNVFDSSKMKEPDVSINKLAKIATWPMTSLENILSKDFSSIKKFLFEKRKYSDNAFSSFLNINNEIDIVIKEPILKFVDDYKNEANLGNLQCLYSYTNVFDCKFIDSSTILLQSNYLGLNNNLGKEEEKFYPNFWSFPESEFQDVYDKFTNYKLKAISFDENEKLFKLKESSFSYRKDKEFNFQNAFGEGIPYENAPAFWQKFLNQISEKKTCSMDSDTLKLFYTLKNKNKVLDAIYSLRGPGCSILHDLIYYQLEYKNFKLCSEGDFRKLGSKLQLCKELKEYIKQYPDSNYVKDVLKNLNSSLHDEEELKVERE